MDAKSEADRFIGIDVSKARVDVHVPRAPRCATDTDGLAALVGRLAPLRPRLVVLEAIGGYEGVVAAALAEAGLPVAIVNPRQVRKFAGAMASWPRLMRDRRCCDRLLAQAVRPSPPRLCNL